MTDTFDIEDWQNFFDQRVRGQGRRNLVEGYLKYIKELQKSDFPPIFELRHLAMMIGISEEILVCIINSPQSFYRRFSIPKRLGGNRTIETPSPVLLNAQRWVNHNILSKIDVGEHCFGFVPGRSIIDNARHHLNRPILLKMDLLNFFPSISQKRVMKVFLQAGYPISISYFLTAICCCGGKLPQGAATSPTLSNLVTDRLDNGLAAYAHRRNLVYTRYADDISVSGDQIGSSEIKQIRHIIEKQGFKPNDRKTRLLRENSQKIITGISISNGKTALPRRTVRQIKLEAYHILKFGYFEHSAHLGKRDPLLLEKLLGRIGFWLQVDPNNATAKQLQHDLRDYIVKFDEELQ